MDATPYSDIRETLGTGDIILFSGKGGISSLIKRFTMSRWSHIGMVVRAAEWDMVLLWESTTLSTIVDLETQTARKGVQLVPLSDRVAGYDGEMAVRRLGPAPAAPQIAALVELRHEVKGRPYEESELELLRSAYDGLAGANVEDLSSLFCSELVAEAYQRMGLLGEETPSNEYTPKDFAMGGPVDDAIRRCGARLGDETLIER